MINLLKRDKNDIIELIVQSQSKKLAIVELAIENAKNMIASTIAKSEFKVYKKNKYGKIKEIKDDNYYRLNIMPNPNETATTFWMRVVDKLFSENEVLIVFINDCMYMADSFQKDNMVISENTFSNIVVSSGGNEYSINKSFKRSEVLYFENTNDKILRLIEKFNEEYGEMMSVALNGYKISNAKKYSLDIPSQISILDKDGKTTTRNAYAKEVKTKLESGETEVLLSGIGISIADIDKSQTKSADDIQKFSIMIVELTAFSFNIPIDVFYGKTTEKSNALNDFITFAIEPIVEIINDGCNSSLVSADDYKSGEKIQIDKSTIKHYDILDVATNLDKLFAMGFSHNDICRMVGLNEVDEPWANEHNMTKNYDKMHDSRKGGDDNE